MDRLRRALDLFVAGAADGAPLSIKIRSIAQQTQKTIRVGLNRCEESAAASRAKLLLLPRQLRARLQTQRKQQEGPSQPKSAEALYVALWDRMLRAIGRAAVNHETDDWPEYFNGLRALTRKLVTESTTSGLSDAEKETLIRRLLEQIDQFERCWPSANAASDTSKDQEAAARVTPDLIQQIDQFERCWPSANAASDTSKDQEAAAGVTPDLIQGKPEAAEPMRPRRRDDDPSSKEALDGRLATKPPRAIAAGRVEPHPDADDQLRNWLTPAPAPPASSPRSGGIELVRGEKDQRETPHRQEGSPENPEPSAHGDVAGPSGARRP